MELIFPEYFFATPNPVKTPKCCIVLILLYVLEAVDLCVLAYSLF